MRRYVNITDIRGLRSWEHQPSARLYMYMCMTCDWQTGRWSGTRRRVSLEIGLSDQEYRTAMKNLEADGLIEMAPKDAAAPPQSLTQESTQRATHHLTQRATQVVVVIYKDLGGGVSPKEQPNEQPKEQPKGQPHNNNSKNNKTYSLTLARARVPGLVDEVAEYIHASREEAVHAIRSFIDAMGKKGKVWQDEGDMRAHLMDWTLKRWTGVESRLSAENLQRSRRERDAKAAELSDERAARNEKENYIKGWLDAVTSSKRALEMVTKWIENGMFDKPQAAETARKWAAENPEKAKLTWELLGWQPSETD